MDKVKKIKKIIGLVVGGGGCISSPLLFLIVAAALFGGIISQLFNVSSSASGSNDLYIDEQYAEIVMMYSKEFDVPAALVFAVIKAESGFDPTVVSSVGARGLMQMMPSTFDGFKKANFPDDPYTSDDLFNPEVSIKYGTKYLANLLKKYGEKESALAAYNAGSGNVDKWLRDPQYSSGGKLVTIPFAETRAYVKIVIKYYEEYLDKATAGGSGSLTDNLNTIEGKTNVGLVNFVYNALNMKSAYIYGAHGQTVTMEFLLQQADTFRGDQYANLTPSEVAKIYEKYAGHPSFDCIGLIKAYWWLDEKTGKITYGSNGAADMGANAACNSYAVKSGSINTMPEVIGLAVWQPGHIGVYVGNGYVIEAQGNSTGVCKTKLAGSRWTKWLQLPYMDYKTTGTYIINGKSVTIG